MVQVGSSTCGCSENEGVELETSTARRRTSGEGFPSGMDAMEIVPQIALNEQNEQLVRLRVDVLVRSSVLHLKRST